MSRNLSEDTKDLPYYRPQRSYSKVMFLHLSVILFTGGVSASSPGQVPWADTPLGRHPLWADTPTPGQTPPAQYILIHTPSQCMLGYGQQAGGTHPTGMHSCWCKQGKLNEFGKFGESDKSLKHELGSL